MIHVHYDVYFPGSSVITAVVAWVLSFISTFFNHIIDLHCENRMIAKKPASTLSCGNGCHVVQHIQDFHKNTIMKSCP